MELFNQTKSEVDYNTCFDQVLKARISFTVLTYIIMFLWPRQEVLQLILPQLSNHGRPLTYDLVLSTVKKLARSQSPDGTIGYYLFILF